jgi:hypothetical protein
VENVEYKYYYSALFFCIGMFCTDTGDYYIIDYCIVLLNECGPAVNVMISDDGGMTPKHVIRLT